MESQAHLSTTKKLLDVRTRADLLAAGYTDRTIARALSSRQLLKLGRFWYGSSVTPPQVAWALASDHRLTCVSALVLHGVFVIETSGVHVVGRQCRCTAHEGKIHHPGLRRWPDAEPILPILHALTHACRCLDAEGAAIALESALNKELIRSDDVPAIFDRLPVRKRKAIGDPDARAMSGPETRVRRFFEKRGVKVQPQFPLPDGGFADMLVGERLLIECDSKSHHTDAKAFAADRHRDQRNVARGYMVVRLTYQDVMDNWLTTQRFLLGLIRRGAHRLPRPRR